MGRRAAGEMPRVVVHEASGNARVRFGGKTHWLGRSPQGVVTPEQLAKAARLWNEHLGTAAAGASTPTPVAEMVEVAVTPIAPPTITSGITGDVDLNVEDRKVRINTREGASSVLTLLDDAMDKINQTRATMGAVMNRMEHVISNLSNVTTNLSASRSQIEDADYAAASTELAKAQIMQQAATAVLAQANTSQQTVLKLLQG